MIRLRDQGQGISKQDLPRIFDLFSQNPSRSSSPSEGLGIGLTIARQLVEMHNGQLSAHSEGLGLGSEFTVILPVLESQPTEDDSPKTQPGASTRYRDGRSWSWMTMRTPPIRWLVCCGCATYIAYSGEQALRVAADIKADVILLDIGMPGIDGYTVARRLREECGLWNSLIVAQTGWGQPRDRNSSRVAGFDHHLVKPVDLDELERLLLSSRRSV